MKQVDVEQFEQAGFSIVPGLLSAAEIAELIQLVAGFESRYTKLRGGIRDIMDAVPGLCAVAEHAPVRALVGQILGPDSFVVRSTLFDKTAESNWKVPWHQDLTIAVQERRDVPGYGPWSVKNGVVHVQPPTRVLERMLTIRIHLDPCPSDNGVLRVMPGSHVRGRLNQNAVAPYVDEARAVCCEAGPGDSLVMRPLLLHASSSASHADHRRVLHFDYATGGLDNGLCWRTPSRESEYELAKAEEL